MPEGKLEDHVFIIYSNGDKYVGDVRDGLPDGYGTIASIDGDMYSGWWKNGRQHGHGTYIWTDGDFFIGMSKDGERHGKGAYFVDGEMYEEEWENGQLIKIEGPICDKTALQKEKNKMKHFQNMRAVFARKL